MNLSIEKIDPDQGQPRTIFDEDAIEGLASSMAATGQAVAILVRPVGDRFVIIHGERRYRAALRLGWRELRAEISDANTENVPWLALAENVQRQDLTPIEEAKAYQRMVDAGFTQGEVGRRVGKTQSYVAQKLRLLRLPSSVQELLSARAITEGHARQLLRLDYGERYNTAVAIQRIADRAVTDQWSVKRIKLEVDFEQVAHDGYWLLPIDEKWKFQDLIDMERMPLGDDERHLVQLRIGEMLGFAERLWSIGADHFAKLLLEDAPLIDAYIVLTWFREFQRINDGRIDLAGWLRTRFAINHFDQAKQRFHLAGDAMPEDPDREAISAFWINMVGDIDRYFEVMFRNYVT